MAIGKIVSGVAKVAKAAVRTAAEKQLLDDGLDTLLNTVNKRISRLEKYNLTDTPAYNRLKEMEFVKVNSKGQMRFTKKGVQGYRELKRLEKELNLFKGYKTSTKPGYTKFVQSTLRNTGVKIPKNLSLPEAQTFNKNFYDLYGKMKDYLITKEGSFDAIGSDVVQAEIAEYVETNNIDLTQKDIDIEELISMLEGVINYENLYDYDYSKLSNYKPTNIKIIK
jgi:hypothetical protein